MPDDRYERRPVPHAPPGYFAVVMCEECHVFGLGDAMVIVYDRQQHTAAVLCEPCARKRGVGAQQSEAMEHDGA